MIYNEDIFPEITDSDQQIQQYRQQIEAMQRHIAQQLGPLQQQIAAQPPRPPLPRPIPYQGGMNLGSAAIPRPVSSPPSITTATSTTATAQQAPVTSSAVTCSAPAFSQPPQDPRPFTCQKILSGHTHSVLALAPLPGSLLASGGHDSTVRIWNIDSGQCVKTLSGHKGHPCVPIERLNGHMGPVSALAVLPDGSLASGGHDSTVRIWNINSDKCMKTLIASPNACIVTALAVLPRGLLASLKSIRTNLVGVPGPSTVQIWNINSGQFVKALKNVHIVDVIGAATVLTVLPDGSLALGSRMGSVQIWDINNDQSIKIISGHKGSVWALATLPGGLLASGGQDKLVRIWNTNSGQCLKTLSGHTQDVLALAALPGSLLASGSQDSTVRIWNTNSGQCLKVLSGHTGPIRALTALPEGLLASGSEDNTVRIWGS